MLVSSSTPSIMPPGMIPAFSFSSIASIWAMPASSWALPSTAAAYCRFSSSLSSASLSALYSSEFSIFAMASSSWARDFFISSMAASPPLIA